MRAMCHDRVALRADADLPATNGGGVKDGRSPPPRGATTASVLDLAEYGACRQPHHGRARCASRRRWPSSRWTRTPSTGPPRNALGEASPDLLLLFDQKSNSSMEHRLEGRDCG